MKTKLKSSILLSIFSIVPLFLFSCSAKKNDGEYVYNQTLQGPIRGKKNLDVNRFLGVKYGLDNGDWFYNVPKNPASHPYVKDCSHYGHSCFQPESILNVNKSEMDYDCLNLNIWTPSIQQDANLPVLVWIHGGGFCIGSGNETLYDGTFFAHQGICFVDVSYRLNIFGFLTLNSTSSQALNDLDEPLFWTNSNHTQTTTTQTSYPVMTNGNWGILDQIKALQWIHKNIKFFGGNKNNVTLAGESAGAMCISGLLVSKAAMPSSQSDNEPLFHRVIMESGNILGVNALDCYTSYMDLENSIKQSQFILNILGLKDNAEDLKKLKSYSDPFHLTKITTLNWDLADVKQIFNNFPLYPTYDGWVLPFNIKATIQSGDFNDVDILAGWNKNEGMMFCLDDEYGIFPYSMEEYSTKQLYEWCFETNVRNRIRNYQDVGVNYDSYKTHVSHGFTKDDPSYFRELIKLAGFSATTMSQIELIKSYHTANFITNKHIYLYCFEYVPDFNSFSLYPHDSDPTHMCELFFVFNHFVLGGENLLNVSSNDEEMSEIMSSLWIKYVKNNLTSSDWIDYSVGSSQMHFVGGKGYSPHIVQGNIDDKANIEYLVNSFYNA